MCSLFTRTNFCLHWFPNDFTWTARFKIIPLRSETQSQLWFNTQTESEINLLGKCMFFAVLCVTSIWHCTGIISFEMNTANTKQIEMSIWSVQVFKRKKSQAEFFPCPGQGGPNGMVAFDGRIDHNLPLHQKAWLCSLASVQAMAN